MSDQTRSDILDGLLLGDAYIPRNQKLLYFAQSQKNREYVVFVARQLGVAPERVLDRTRQPDKRTGKAYVCSELRTLSDPLFARLRERWYRDGKKVVPEDLKVSPECVLHWFLCDGACSVLRGRAQMMLCTDGFRPDEVERLRSLLASVDVESSQTAGPRIRVHQKSIERFYEYIGDCPVTCLAYKWVPAESRTSRQTDLKPFYQRIHDLHVIDRWPCSRIAQEFGTNYYSVRYVLKTHFGIRFGKNATTETTCREGLAAPSETARRAPSLDG